jgi:hypothetical protein
MQLVAYGAQDIYLTGNPQITFFKVVYRRHTNFAVESIEQTFNGQADFGRRVTATISRNGDLIQQMYLEVVLPYTSSGSDADIWVYGIGNAMINKAEIEIGGQLIDRQYGEWMNIWTELSTPAGKRDGYDNMVGNQLDGLNVATATNYQNDVRLYVPLQFWFNRNPGLALPLIALQYHEVKLNLELNALGTLTNETTTNIANSPSIKLFVDYVYLDTDERRRFAQVSHEYLIEQVQFTGDVSIASGDTTKNVTLNFNHPVKELIWAHRLSSLPASTAASAWNYMNFSTGNGTAATFDTFLTGLLQLNGHDRFSVRYADYFRKVQNYEHHQRVPRTTQENYTDNDAAAAVGYRNQFIYSYSFALSPEEHQPSGTCNFSRIDNAVLQLTYSTANPNHTSAALALKVFAVNYNVLRIMSGMGGLAYSN